MRTIKRTLIAAAIATTMTSAAQAEGLSSSLPLGKSLAVGHDSVSYTHLTLPTTPYV